jgi:hypothetical protein
MQPIEVVWWGGQRGSWCQAIVEFLTEGMTHRMAISELQGDGAVFVVKADQFQRKSMVVQFHEDTVRLNWMLLIVTANEEIGWPMAYFERTGKFKKWLQTPHRFQACSRAIPWGWTPGCATEVRIPKLYDWSFGGQITHSRREEFLKVARTLPAENRMLVTSEGFSQGIAQGAYYKMLAATKVAPCPSGPITVDSMRVCEALQNGCVPVVDSVSPTGAYPEYWKRVFGEYHPIPYVSHWQEFPEICAKLLQNWPASSPHVSEWYSQWKANLKLALYQDLGAL